MPQNCWPLQMVLRFSTNKLIRSSKLGADIRHFRVTFISNLYIVLKQIRKMGDHHPKIYDRREVDCSIIEQVPEGVTSYN